MLRLALPQQAELVRGFLIARHLVTVEKGDDRALRAAVTEALG